MCVLMEILDEYSRFSARPFTSVTPLRASGGDGTKSVGVVFSIIDSALPPYTSALHISQEVRIRTDMEVTFYCAMLLTHNVGEVLTRALRHIVRVRIVVPPEAPMTPAIAGRASPSAPSARDEPSVSEE
jgi:hypothetical protein